MNLDQAEEFFDKLEVAGGLKQPYIIPKRKLEDHVAGDGAAPVQASLVNEGDSDPKRRRIGEAGGEPEGPPDRFRDCGPLNSVEDLRSFHSNLFNEELPEELLAKFRPEICNLCFVDLATPSGKKYHHYNGNPHRKSIMKEMQNLGLPRPTRKNQPESARAPIAVAVVSEVNNVVVQLADDDVRALHGNLFCEQLPEEILTKFLATKCDLCLIDFTSPNGARSHYYGNPHRKSLTKFMTSLGLPGPTRRSEQQVPDALVNLQPDQDIRYCQLCKVDLTSEIVAMSHYTGKNHAKKRRAYDAQNAAAAAASTAGVQEQPQQVQVQVPGQATQIKNGDNKDQRASSFYCMPCQMNFNNSDEYTVHFCSVEHKAKCAANNSAGGTESQTPGSELGVSEMLSRIRSDPNSPFECSVCHVRTTGEENMKMHLAGKNHKKKLAQQQLAAIQPAAAAVGGAMQQPAAVAIGGALPQPVATLMRGAVQQPAFGDQVQLGSPFRCDYCQVTTTDQSTLALHLNGKKHAKRMADLGI